MKTDGDLWRRIEAVELDRLDVTLPFSARLAGDNGWSREHADAVVREYRRFCYLAMVAGHEVTPSDEVDQAWHLHLSYTRHYWGRFVRVLGRPLHHGPTEGGPDEQRRYLANYEATLASYEREFDGRPPSTIWPPSHIRFGDAPYMRRINRRRHWVIPKPRLRAASLAMATLAALAAAALWSTSAGAHSTLEGKAGLEYYSTWIKHMLDVHPITLVGGAVILIVVIVGIETSLSRSSRGAGGADRTGSGGSCSGGCGGGGGCGGS